MKFEIEKLEPAKQDLEKIASKYKGLTIDGPADKSGYAIVDEARKRLKRLRVDIKKRGKEMRDEANQYAKAVIAKEKELVEIIEPLEIELKGKQDAIDMELLKIKMAKKLPEMHKQLAEIDAAITDDEILAMSFQN